jgi:Endonuclease/Exonuclease/phosphatase family
VRYPTSQGRSLLVLEMNDAGGIAVSPNCFYTLLIIYNECRQLRIGTSHFESLLEDKPFRHAQFTIARNALSLSCKTSVLHATDDILRRKPSDNASTATTTSTPHAILLGDTNVYQFAELAPLLDPSFGLVDAYAAVHRSGCGEGKPDDATWGMTYPTRWPGKKIDYVIFRSGGSIESGYSPIRDDSSLPSMKAIEAQLLGNDPIPGKSYVGGRDGKLYPSDHLGVLIRFVGM